MVSDEALKKLQEQIAAWPMERRFVVQQLIRDYLRNWEDVRAYEAAGLTAEEVSTLVKDWNELCTIVGECGGITRVKALAEADKDGRVVALPVKPVLTPILSSMLYIIEDEDIYEDALYEAVVGMSGNGEMNVVYTTLSDQITFEQADIGKTVFLTREEAKKALEATKEGAEEAKRNEWFT
jgi:hypothetical protein